MHTFEQEQELYKAEGIQWKAIAYSDNRDCPDLLQGFMYRYGLLWSHSRLDPVLKDLVRLKSANLNGCVY